MAGPRRTEVCFVLEAERDLPPEQQTRFFIDEPDPFVYEDYMASTKMDLKRGGKEISNARTPYTAKVTFLVKCIGRIENFGGQNYEGSGPIRKLFAEKQVRASDIAELLDACTNAASLTEGEVKNSDASPGSKTDSENTGEAEDSTTATTV